MTVEFLLGAAGSGKTHTCLAQVCQALAEPDGPSLLWIAPKQFTFQLEREVLARGIRGFTRLEILPFDRVARRVLSELGGPALDVLPEEGRVMVLQAILLREASRLELLGPSARAPGFAGQLSQVLRELQQSGIGTERLRKTARSSSAVGSLSAKLADLALLLDAYRAWLGAHGLHDPDDLLGLATAALDDARQQGKTVPACAGLWLDGFAEMTLPELDLLVALLPGCARATLAFCLDAAPGPAGVSGASPLAAPPSPASLWTVTWATFARCEERVRALGLPVQMRHLPEAGEGVPRFRNAPALDWLAAGWIGRGDISLTRPSGTLSRPTGEGRGEGPSPDRSGLNLVECVDPEAEALLAVRLINRHVREPGGRFRDVSVIVRRMEGYGDVVQRAFRRHGIPYFADHREPMGHHPVAELTRSALRLAARGGAHEDWLGALKSGLVIESADFVDRLENAGLANGLRGDEWMRIEEYRQQAELTDDAVRELEQPVAALAKWRSSAGLEVSGAGLAAALRTLWSDLRVRETLDRWQLEAGDLPPVYRAIHHTAWAQIGTWCDALELAFADTTLPLVEWCAIAETGLSRLTLGIVPPALDQVLLGAIDRMRQPDVKLTVVLGLNEGVFPSAPPSPALLSHVERQALALEGFSLGWTRLDLAAREHYYGYIACTRPSQKLCLTWSRRGRDGQAQVRSSVAERVLAQVGLKPDAEAEAGDATRFDGKLKAFAGEPQPVEAVTLSELLECPRWDQALDGGPNSAPAGDPPPSTESAAAGDSQPALERSLPALVLATRERVVRLRASLLPASRESGRRLDPGLMKSLHPQGVLESSVSAIEDFAECPFRYFAKYRLRLEERDEFEADPMGAGTLLHAILKAFHDRTMAERGAWRRWSPTEASELVTSLGEEQLKQRQFAPLVQDALTAWETRRRIRGLAAMVGQAVAWMATYAFDPRLAELRFGGPGDEAVPAWKLTLDQDRELRLRGSIDRLDVCRSSDGPVLVAVQDYKSTAQPPNQAKLDHGYELQLLAYLAFAAESPELRALVSPGVPEPPALQPAGAFYVPLAPRVSNLDPTTSAEKRQQKYLDSLAHQGRGDGAWLAQFDSLGANPPQRGDRSHQFSRGHLLGSDRFRGEIACTVDWLKRHAADILEGRVGVEPVRYNSYETACEYCPFQPLCRFEPWRGGFRTLPPAKPQDVAE